MEHSPTKVLPTELNFPDENFTFADETISSVKRNFQQCSWYTIKNYVLEIAMDDGFHQTHMEVVESSR